MAVVVVVVDHILLFLIKGYNNMKSPLFAE